MPLLLRGLDLPDNEIRASVIDTLQAAATSSSEAGSKDNAIVAEHATGLVSTMLKNSLVETMPSVVSRQILSLYPLSLSLSNTVSQRVRVAALRYLATLPSVVRYDVLHPQKTTVIRELAKALDDPKRVVRSEAVEAR